MPLNARDLWIVLKAQDQTNRALSSFGRNVRNAGNQVLAAQLEARKAAALGAIAQDRQNIAMERSVIGQIAAQKAMNNLAISRRADLGLTDAQVGALRDQNDRLTAETVNRRRNISAIEQSVLMRQGELRAVNGQIHQLDSYNKSVQDQERNLAHLSGRMQSVAQTATAAGFAFSAAGALTLFGLKKLVDSAVEYDRQVRLTATQVDNFSGNLMELGDIGRRVAKDIAVPFETIQPALFDIFSSMDVGLKDAENLLRSFSKAAVAGQTDIQSVSRATIGILNAFGLPASKVNDILDIQFKLVQKGIGTYEEWNQRIGLVTPSAVRAGQSIQVMVAALAASTRQGISAARSGTAVARAFDALSNPAAVTALKNLGVSAMDAQGHFRPFNQVLRDFRDVLMKMPEKDRLKTILDVFKGAGGTIEARRFLQNMLLGKGALEDFDQILGQVSQSSGAMEKAYEQMAGGAAAQSQLLRNQWDLMKESVGRALIPAFVTLTNWLNKVLQAFNNLPDSTKHTIAMLLLVGGAFATIMGPLLLILGAIGSFAAAIAVAGTALLVTVAAISALAVGLGVLVAGFIIAYKKSLEFRVLIGQIHTYFKLVADAASEFGKRLREAFNEKLRGPLQSLADVISNKLLPQLTILENFIVSKVVPKIREAARILGDIFGKAIEVVGGMIQRFLVPAIQFASDWIAKHREEILKLLPYFAQFVKWVLIIGGVLVGVLAAVLIGPVIGAIIAVIAVVAALVAAFVYVQEGVGYLWGKLKEFWSWLTGAYVDAWTSAGETLKSVWSAISSFFVSIWNSIASFFVSIWNSITSALGAALSWIGGVWSSFWSGPFSKLFIDMWHLLVAVLQNVWAVIEYVLLTAWGWVKNGWGMFLSGLSAVWNAAWGAISSFAQWVWNGIVGFLSSVWSTIRSIASGLWLATKQAIVGPVTSAVEFIKNKWNEGWARLSSIWNSIKGTASAAWNAVYNAIAGPVQSAYNKVTGVFSSILSRLRGLAGDFYHAGVDMIMGLVNGIDSMIKKVTDKINHLTSIIKDHLPGSPVKTGPLKVLNRGHAGKQITRMIADGMEAGIPYLQDRTNRVANSINAGYDAPDFMGAAARDRAAWSKIYNINQTINTQEINPTRQAAALGWEVQTVL